MTDNFSQDAIRERVATEFHLPEVSGLLTVQRAIALRTGVPPRRCQHCGRYWWIESLAREHLLYCGFCKAAGVGRLELQSWRTVGTMPDVPIHLREWVGVLGADVLEC